ncbi:MAG: hypothetical protein JRH20_09585 [Deltaproteobacteria bacterium]|nr:hypothetical protein [Deltaproteobacteria bacterium]
MREPKQKSARHRKFPRGSCSARGVVGGVFLVNLCAFLCACSDCPDCACARDGGATEGLDALADVTLSTEQPTLNDMRDDTTTDAQLDSSGPVCSTDHWCAMDAPLPTKSNLRAVWAVAANDIYAVGDAVLHYDGNGWSVLETPMTGSLRAVWASGPDNIIAVGTSGAVLRYDGSQWLASSGGPNLTGVWGSSKDNIYAVGINGAIRHFDGNRWTLVTSPTLKTLNSIWGRTKDDIYAVGQQGMAIHFDGTRWSLLEPTGTTQEFYGVWGGPAASDDVYAVGRGGTRLRYSGGQWSATNNTMTDALYGVWGTSAANVFAFGGNGLVQQFNGTQWTDNLRRTVPILYAMGGSGPDNLFVVGAAGTILHKTTSWLVMHSAAALHAITATPSGQVIAAGNDGIIYRYDGAWSRLPFNARRHIYGLSATAPDDIFAVSSGGYIARYDGLAWTTERPTTQSLHAVWRNANSPTEVSAVAVGTNSAIVHFQAGVWAMQTPPIVEKDLRGVWGSGPADIFAVGESGTIMHFDGSRWATQASSTQAYLYAVWGRSATEVYAVGNSGTVLRYDGTTWKPMDLKVTTGFRAVVGVGSDELYVGSSQNLVYHYDGESWSLQRFPAPGSSNALWHDGATGVYSAGNASSIFRRSP